MSTGVYMEKIDPFLLDLVLEADEAQKIEDWNDSLAVDRILAERVSNAARQAHSHITGKLGLAFFRPPTIQVEMFKTEEAMQRAKKRKEEEEAAARELERIKKERENKRFAKKMATEAKVAKQAELAKNKRALKEEFNPKKGKKSLLQKVGGRDEFEVDARDADFDVDLSEDDVGEDDGKNKHGKNKQKGKKRQSNVSGKRKHKNEKYGFGGKKRGLKSNTRESTYSGKDSFNPKKMKQPFKGGVGKKR